MYVLNENAVKIPLEASLSLIHVFRKTGDKKMQVSFQKTNMLNLIAKCGDLIFVFHNGIGTSNNSMPEFQYCYK